MTPPEEAPSRRRAELLEAAYGVALTQGIGTLSFRPLAAATGSSPGVLLYAFGSKDGLVRALLERARADEQALLADLRGREPAGGLADVAAEVWAWLSAPEHRPTLALWVEAYGRSLTEPDGLWAGFAHATAQDWRQVLTRSQPEARRDCADGVAEVTLTLAVLRGALLDLLATGDVDRTTAAVREHLNRL